MLGALDDEGLFTGMNGEREVSNIPDVVFGCSGRAEITEINGFEITDSRFSGPLTEVELEEVSIDCEEA